MVQRLALSVALVLVTCGWGSQQAAAQCGSYLGGMGYYDIGRLYQVLSQNVPYYAAFPPVYYSAPIPRTYGYSPFAYPPGTMTPELEAPCAAQEIVNPYVVPASAEKQSPAQDQVTSAQGRAASLAVMNPFVVLQVAKARELPAN